MAYLTKKISGNNIYYYAEESHRVNGVRRRKWQKYLGPLFKIIEAIDGVREKPNYAEIFHLGTPSAYLNTVERINLVNSLNNSFHKRKQGLRIGFYLTIAAINRAICPVSKTSLWEWFKDTILLRAFPNVDKNSLSSQLFWDNTKKISYNAIQNAWKQIVDKTIAHENIDLSNVSCDGTNFYTFISSFNMRCSIAKRGKNKQGRRDKKQVSFALFCTRKDHFPLYFDVYEGNKHDSKEFEKIIEKFFKNFNDKCNSNKGITIVFDKGNNSKDNFEKFINNPNYHFVGSVKVDDHKELGPVLNNDKRFIKLSNPKLEDVKAFRVKKIIYGIEMTIIEITFWDPDGQLLRSAS